MVNAFKALKFRNKIIVIFILAVLVVMASILMALPAIKTTVLNSARQELITTTNLAATSAESLYENAIRNYLRGITETHLNTLKLKYKQYQAG
jgi:Tfp pilus assembly protein PilX